MYFSKIETWKKTIRFLLLALVYCATSALVLDRFMIYNGTINQSHGGGFDKYLKHEMVRPFAYRVLIPTAVDFIEPKITLNLSESVKYKLTKGTPLREYMGVSDGQEISLSMSVKYHLAYFICFISLVGLMFMLKALANAVTPNDFNLSNFSPLVFVLMLPLTFLHGGFIYDFPELFFLSAALFAIIKGNFPTLCAVTPFAILNKESNVLIPVFYITYTWGGLALTQHGHKILALSVIAGSAYGLGHLMTSDTAGVVVMQHWAQNLSFLGDHKSYFLWERLYGGLIAFPRGYNLVTVIVFISIVVSSWKCIETPTKRLFLVVFAINLYLVLAHGNRDEIRNWSLTLPILYLFAVRFFSPQNNISNDRH